MKAWKFFILFVMLVVTSMPVLSARDDDLVNDSDLLLIPASSVNSTIVEEIQLAVLSANSLLADSMVVSEHVIIEAVFGDCNFNKPLSIPVAISGVPHQTYINPQIEIWGQNGLLACNDLLSDNLIIKSASVVGNLSIKGDIVAGQASGSFTIHGDDGYLLYSTDDLYFPDYYFVNGQAQIKGASYRGNLFPDMAATVENVKIDVKKSFDLVDRFSDGNMISLGDLGELVPNGIVKVATKSCPQVTIRFNGSRSVKIETACTKPSSFNVSLDSGKPSSTVKPQVLYADVPASSWAFDYIHAIRDAGITGGCGGNNYCPKAIVTREQMAAFLVRAVEKEPPSNYCGNKSPFQDISTGKWSCPHIKRLNELKLTGGCGNGKYCPASLVTREQMAAFVVRAVSGEPGSCGGVSPFKDVSPNSWSCRYIKKLVQLGITAGCGNGKYCPGAHVNREQMAAFLARAFLNMD